MSKHFEVQEFLCPCCRQGAEELQPHFDELTERLEHLRRLLGNAPMIITSGYRCFAHNRAVGGAKNSLHMQGLAVDFKVPSLPWENVMQTLPYSKFGGIGVYHGTKHVHVDMRDTRTMWSVRGNKRRMLRISEQDMPEYEADRVDVDEK